MEAVVEAAPPSPPSLVARLALLVNDRSWARPGGGDARVRDFLEIVKAGAGEQRAVTLRLARLLAWAKTQDIGIARYPSWSAFLKDFSPWHESHTRDLVRLVESKLTEIKDAASAEVIDLTVALRALKRLGPSATREAQLAYLAEATLKTAPTPRPPAAGTERLTGDEMRKVLKARELAATLIGWDAPLRVIDDFILDCHAKNLTGEQILGRAREVPPRPPRLGKEVPEWRNDPSVSVLGPWVEPTGIHDAIAKLRAVRLLLEVRRVTLGKAYCRIRDECMWTSIPGCKSLAECCLVHLGIAQRTFQRYAKEGRCHFACPRAESGIAAGTLTGDQAMFAMTRSSERTVEDWLDFAHRLGRAEIERAEEWERERHVRLREAFAPALDVARAVDGIVRDVVANGIGDQLDKATPIGGPGVAADEATRIGGTAKDIALHVLTVGATGPIQVALRDDRKRRSPAREPQRILAPKRLLAAAEYLLSEVKIRKQYGPRKVVEHDTWTCQNPRCRRRTLRVNVHHILERHQGGSDDPANLVTLCPACHQRGVHSRHLWVARIDDCLVWAWPSGWRPRSGSGPSARWPRPPQGGGPGGVVIMHSPVRASGAARSAPH